MATYTKVYNNPYPDGWKDGKDGNTPVTADILNNQTETLESIEQYLADNPIEQGGGSSGTTDYETLENKPTINGVEVVGDLSLEDLGITGGGGSGTTDYNDLTNKPSINGTELSGDITLDIPTKTSDLENDSGFLTNINGKSYNDLADKPQINGIDLQGNLTVEELGLLDITESTDTTLENSKDGILKIKDIYGNTIQDGEPTPDVPIEIKSVVISEIRTCGKNMFSGVPFEENVYYSLENVKTALDTWDTYIASVTGGESYTVSGIDTATGGSGFLAFENDTFLGSLSSYKNGTFTVPINCNKLKYSVRKSGKDAFMIEEGEVATDYEPYTESVATLSNSITLNGLNGVRDNVDLKRGVLVQKFGKTVLNGTENWREVSVSAGLFRADVDGLDSAKGSSSYQPVICSHYDVEYSSAKVCCYLSTTQGRMGFVSNHVSTLDEWKTWLSSNNVTVIYELEEPIETPLPDADVEALKSLKTYDGVTHIFTDSDVAPDWLVEYNTTRVGTELDEIDAELVKINKRITDIGTTAQINYSTEEQVVGTWIDGRVLYQKTYDITGITLSANTWYDYIIDNTGIDFVTKIEGYRVSSDKGQTHPMNQYKTSDESLQGCTFLYNADLPAIAIRPTSANTDTGAHWYVTMQYVKTTDTV